MDNKKVGELIASLRKKKGLTQEQLGELVSVGAGAVSKWERGINTPDKSIINLLSEILGISSTELLKGEINEVVVEEEIADKTESNEIVNIVKEEVIEEILEKESYKKANNLKNILIVLFIVIGVIISTVFIYNKVNNKTYVYNLLSTSDDYYIDGKAIFKGDELSLVVNKIKFKDDELNSVLIKNYEYDVISNNIIIVKQGYINLINQLETEQKIWEFLNNFRINHNAKMINVSRQNLINNNITITLKLLDVNDNVIVNKIKISLQKVD